MINYRKINSIDKVFLMVLGLLIVYGLIVLSSASYSLTNSSGYYLIRQLIWIAVGIAIVLIIVRYFDFAQFSQYSLQIYIITIVMLIAVLLFGKEVRGSTGWIGIGSMTFQPGEFAKIFIVLSFAAFLKKRVNNLNTLWEIIPCLFYMGLPFLLVAIQPNIGTALAFIFIAFGMMMIAGTNLRILMSVLIVCIAIPILMVFLHQHFGLWLPLKDYQLNRLLVFANPYNDGAGGRGAGWNTIQSLTAVGSGGLSGKGLFHGTQIQLNFLPERHTDFIFAVIGEELGFIGAVVLLILYSILLIRALKIAENTGDMFTTLVSVGLVSIWLYHIFQNIGMCIGIMPITGLPLPFVSYGGSFMITNAIAVGLLIKADINGKKVIF